MIAILFAFAKSKSSMRRAADRGRPEDPKAIDILRDANPAAPIPKFLECPEGLVLRCALGAEEIQEALSLLEGTYWNQGVSNDVIARSLLASSAWIGAED